MAEGDEHLQCQIYN